MKWNIDPTHSQIAFSVKHLMISTVRGHFSKFEGSGETNASDIVTSLNFTMDMASVDTNTPQRDDHLRSPDFFDTAKYPTATFASTKIKQAGEDITIEGTLTMHGVTAPVTLTGELTKPITDPWGNPRRALTVSGKLNRKDWGLTYNMAIEAGGVVISEEVKLIIDVAAVGEKAAA